jgi:hypothetical protein
MANALSAKARSLFLNGDIDWANDDFKIVALDSSYSYNSGHDFLDDISGGAIVATSSNLAGKATLSDGSADSNDVVFAALAAGDTITQLWLYKDTGSAATSPLVAYYDTDSTPAMIDVDTNGGDVTVQPVSSGWFRL